MTFISPGVSCLHSMNILTKFSLFAGCAMLMYRFAQAQDRSPDLAQVVAVDECDPVTFNQALVPDFCKNIALGYVATLSQLFAEAQAGIPDPNRDFEPDTVHMKKQTTLSVVDQGGEPHLLLRSHSLVAALLRDSCSTSAKSVTSIAPGWA